jgi:membrane protease YdiL (CAAX protease family)
MVRTLAPRFLAVLLTALALVPAGAHLLALPNKLAMSREAYLAAQAAYAGWAVAGILPIGAILSCLTLALRREPPAASWSALIAALLLAAGLAVFFAWTRPTNLATANWTTLPEGWEALRAQWEWSHAANAVLTFGALCAVLQAALSGGPRH